MVLEEIPLDPKASTAPREVEDAKLFHLLLHFCNYADLLQHSTCIINEAGQESRCCHKNRSNSNSN